MPAENKLSFLFFFFLWTCLLLCDPFILLSLDEQTLHLLFKTLAFFSSQHRAKWVSCIWNYVNMPGNPSHWTLKGTSPLFADIRNMTHSLRNFEAVGVAVNSPYLSLTPWPYLHMTVIFYWGCNTWYICLRPQSLLKSSSDCECG